ncbi:LytR/AlgR family response regulator transcription factor [candidate division KSB1 bacterium]
MKIKCMIIEDESLAQEVLEQYISSLSILKLVKTCSDALEAIDFLHRHSTDLIFLDLKMPGLSGLKFLETLAHPPKVIITTAYPEYALEGYEHSVIDYLVKPFSFERFLKAVNKVSLPDLPASGSAEGTDEKFIFIKENKIIHKVLFSDIRYIEGCGNFLKVFAGNKTIVFLEKMSNIERNLPEDFIRVHRSYIVSVGKIDMIEGNMIRIGSKTIPVGKHYKLNVEKIIEKYNIK